MAASDEARAGEGLFTTAGAAPESGFIPPEVPPEVAAEVPAESELVAAGGAGGAVVIVPTTSPAARIAALASESFEPTNSGMTNASWTGAALVNTLTEGVENW